MLKYSEIDQDKKRRVIAEIERIFGGNKPEHVKRYVNKMVQSDRMCWGCYQMSNKCHCKKPSELGQVEIEFS